MGRQIGLQDTQQLRGSCRLLGESAASRLGPVVASQVPFGKLGRVNLLRTSSFAVLLWKWLKGTAEKADFGDPVGSDTGYGLCVYKDGTLIMSPVVGADGQWAATTKGYSYKNAATNAAGIFKVVPQESTGKAKVLVKAKGANLTVPALPLSPTTAVKVQLVKDSGPECWESTFPQPAKADDGKLYKDQEP